MRLIQTLSAAALALTVGVSFAQSTAPSTSEKKLTPQQGKMSKCNEEATGKKGEERKAFMKQCLSNTPAAAPAAPMTQQDKMKKCNKDATGKKGDDRKAYMKSCLSA